MFNFISEDDIEKNFISILEKEMHYDGSHNCYSKDYLNRPGVSNNEKTEVLWKDEIVRQLKFINKDLTDLPEIDDDDIKAAMDFLKYDRITDVKMQNARLLSLITGGITLDVKQKNGSKKKCDFKFIDFTNPEQNSFYAINQLWIMGKKLYRPDVIIYINGIPLVVIELKDSNIPVKNAYDDNLTNYKDGLERLMAYNGFLVASNGTQGLLGATYAAWDYYSPWLRKEKSNEAVDTKFVEDGKISLEIMARTLLQKKNLLDYIKNFILFYNGDVKICAKNHQFLGVNKAIERFDYLMNGSAKKEDKGKMGVFWHTQGSGKSFSMVFLARKIVSNFRGNFTFLIVTDREDLDDQIYRNFLHSAFMGENDECRPKDSESLRTALTHNHKILFTLIQKFRYEKNKTYPVLSERNDIIVFIDEAHRTQYKELAENMRIGLPNAQYMAFTGTPLFGDKKLTNKWFGETISEYNFMQAIQDGATVKPVYKNALPQMQNVNVTLSEDFAEIVSDENLTDEEQKKLEEEHSTELEVLKRPERLSVIAHHIVNNFTERGYLGKAMVVSVDRYTAVAMYSYVKDEIQKRLVEFNKEISSVQKDSEEYNKLLKKRDFLKQTDMAVVVSEEAGEEERFKKRGLDIKPHRDRMKSVDDEGQELQDLFKDAYNPLRLVFVCSMWLTGFDAPTVSTLYIDKPLVGHNLMQTIARANRKTDIKDIFNREKTCGEIIGYCNIFGSMNKALSVYADGGSGTGNSSDTEKTDGSCDTVDKIYKQLHETIDECVAWCKEQTDGKSENTTNVDLEKILEIKDKAFSKISLFEDYADILISPKERKSKFLVYDNAIENLYNECLPDITKKKNEFLMANVIHYLRGVMSGMVDYSNIESAKKRIKELLDQSIVPKNSDNNDGANEKQVYTIKEYKAYDLSKVDLKKLRERFKESHHKNLEIDDLQNFLNHKLEIMLKENITRVGFVQKFQEILDSYNSSSEDSVKAFEDLVKLFNELSDEEKRAKEEGLTEQELELFDILKKDRMTKAEEIKVKNGAKDLLKKFAERHDELFPVDWYKTMQTKEKVEKFIGDELNNFLPESYTREIFAVKKEKVFELVMERMAA